MECDRKISRALKRLEEEDAKSAIAISVSEVTQVTLMSSVCISVLIHSLFLTDNLKHVFDKMQSQELLELSKQIREKLKEVDAFGNPSFAELTLI